MIRVEALHKSYGEVLGLAEINLSVEKGELFGLIGPDGAGKTSLIRILATLLLPDKGEAWVANHHVVNDYKTIRKLIGYMPGRFSLYQDLSVEENLNLFATIFGTSLVENYDLIKGIYSQIEPFRKRRAGALSGGMKQKLALSCALIHRPKVLLLDEPTTGVDAVSRREFWDMLDALKDHGITTLVSTPYMDEASRCDRVALINAGRIMQVDTPAGVVGGFQRTLYAVRSREPYRLLQDLRQYPHAYSVQPFGDSIHYADRRDTIPEAALLAFLQEKGHKEISFQAIAPNIEDCFMALMHPQSMQA